MMLASNQTKLYSTSVTHLAWKEISIIELEGYVRKHIVVHAFPQLLCCELYTNLLPNLALYPLQTSPQPLEQVETATLPLSLNSVFPRRECKVEKQFLYSRPVFRTSTQLRDLRSWKVNLTVTILYFGEFLNAIPHVCNISSILVLMLSSVVCFTNSRSSSINDFVPTSSWINDPQFLQHDSIT